MSHSERLVTTTTNLIVLSSITSSMHSAAQESPGTEPLNKTLAGFNTDSVKEIWDDTHQDVAAAVREIQAQAWEEGFTQGAAYYHESGKEPADFTEPAATLNPYKEQA